MQGHRFSQFLSAVVMTALLAGCAAGPRMAAYRPVVDTAGHDPLQVDADAAHCRAMAQQTQAWRDIQSSDRRIAGATLVGALLGAAVGAASADGWSGHQGDFTRWGAGIGAVHGAAWGGGDVAVAVAAYKDVIRSCMAHRGYLVYD